MKLVGVTLDTHTDLLPAAEVVEIVPPAVNTDLGGVGRICNPVGFPHAAAALSPPAARARTATRSRRRRGVGFPTNLWLGAVAPSEEGTAEPGADRPQCPSQPVQLSGLVGGPEARDEAHWQIVQAAA